MDIQSEPTIAAVDYAALRRERQKRMAALLRLDAPTSILLSEMKLILHADICERRGRRVSKLWIVLEVVGYAWHDLRMSIALWWDECKHQTGWCGGPERCDLCQFEAEQALLDAESENDYLERVLGGWNR